MALLVERKEYLAELISWKDEQVIKVVTGIRRCGKSTLLAQYQDWLKTAGVSDAQIVSVNFEELEYEELLDYKKLYAYLKERLVPGKTTYIFLDEIQKVADFEKVIDSLYVKPDVDIYITGSNAKLLSGELATYLGGRYVEFVIYPFSFREFMELYHTVYEGADERQCFTKYLTLGGMPYLSNLRYDDAASRQYLRDLFNSVELKDIIKRNNIRDVDMLERIIAYITSNIGTTFSSTAISKYLKSEGRSVSPETVLNYIKACTDAFLFYQVSGKPCTVAT